mmetsp:Transcript_16908/g.23902  ORF Transcript_16908/g.23902 Transcript_16908/m.23902 type:complete len:288 (+) Transcript_16908:938-1801(+)
MMHQVPMDYSCLPLHLNRARNQNLIIMTKKDKHKDKHNKEDGGGGGTIYLAASSESERNSWIYYLEMAAASSSSSHSRHHHDDTSSISDDEDEEVTFHDTKPLFSLEKTLEEEQVTSNDNDRKLPSSPKEISVMSSSTTNNNNNKTLSSQTKSADKKSTYYTPKTNFCNNNVNIAVDGEITTLYKNIPNNIASKVDSTIHSFLQHLLPCNNDQDKKWMDVTQKLLGNDDGTSVTTSTHTKVEHYRNNHIPKPNGDVEDTFLMMRVTSVFPDVDLMDMFGLLVDPGNR